MYNMCVQLVVGDQPIVVVYEVKVKNITLIIILYCKYSLYEVTLNYYGVGPSIDSMLYI